MKLLKVVLCGAVVASSLCVQQASAVGMGPYLRSRSADATWDSDGQGEADATHDSISIGVTLDTAVARNSVFNYRLDLGYFQMNHEFDDYNDEVEFTGLEWNNTFGFAVYRGRWTRLWLGPALRFTYANGEEDHYGSADDFVLFSAGLGPVFGGNHHCGSVMSIGWAIDYMFQAGTVSWENSGGDDDATLTETGLSAALYFIFHMGGEDRSVY